MLADLSAETDDLVLISLVADLRFDIDDAAVGNVFTSAEQVSRALAATHWDLLETFHKRADAGDEAAAGIFIRLAYSAQHDAHAADLPAALKAAISEATALIMQSQPTNTTSGGGTTGGAAPGGTVTVVGGGPAQSGTGMTTGGGSGRPAVRPRRPGGPGRSGPGRSSPSSPTWSGPNWTPVARSSCPGKPGEHGPACRDQAKVETWLAEERDQAPAIALRAAPAWTGESVLTIGGTAVRIVPCPTPLAARAALHDRADGERLVLLTELSDDDLGEGLLAYVSEQHVRKVDMWDVATQMFKVPAVDPTLVAKGRWVAEALIDHKPAGDWAPASGAVLTRDHALRSLTAELLGLGRDEIDSAGLMQWSTDAGRVLRLEKLPARCSTVSPATSLR